MNEEALLGEIKRDPRKFGDLYEAFYKEIFGYAFRRTRQYDAATVIAAETFLKAYIGIGNFTWRGTSLLYWLYAIATNEINKYYRSRKYTPESLNRIQEEYGVDLTDYSNAETDRILVEEEMSKHQEFAKVQALVATLDSKYQDVISLRYYERKSIAEIAIILDKKEGTIKSLLSRGLDKVRERLTGD